MMLKFFTQEAGLVAFMSDGSIDFTPTDFDAPLSAGQQHYLKQATGIAIPQVFWRKQVHGDTILDVNWEQRSSPQFLDADAYITNEKNLPIAIRTADCVPVFLVDPHQRVIGLAHAGWKGTLAQITLKTVKRMMESYGSNPQDIKAVIAPSIGSCCYEVGKEFNTYFPKNIIVRDNKFYADVAGVNYQQLLAAGLLPEHIIKHTDCTYCGNNYHSFRRDGAQSGRMISLMMIR